MHIIFFSVYSVLGFINIRIIIRIILESLEVVRTICINPQVISGWNEMAVLHSGELWGVVWVLILLLCVAAC